jgi:hypothetical protein
MVVEVSWVTHRILHSKCLVDQRRLANASLLEVPCQQRLEISNKPVPFLSPKFGILETPSVNLNNSTLRRSRLTEDTFEIFRRWWAGALWFRRKKRQVAQPANL